MGLGIRRRRGATIATALATGALLMSVSACGGNANAQTDAKGGGKASASSGAQKASAKPSPTKPAAPPMLLDSIAPQGGTVGVAQPVSVVFTKSVAASARAEVEKHLELKTSQPVVGAWHWFGDRRVDFRPKEYWPSGTKVSLDAAMTGVSDGNGRVGVHSYTHSFTVGADTEVKVSVPGHSMTVMQNGKTVKTMPIDAGSPDFPSWDGTMAVIDKQKDLRMTSCSVGISCTPGAPNYYDDHYPNDVHLTSSGTYIHYSNGDPYPGHANGSHGCVHLSMANSEWFYNFVKPGDPVTITGSPRGNAPADNGYADFNLSWSQFLQGSGEGQITTTTA